MTDWRKLLTDEHLWDYRCKAVPVPLVREIVEEVETLRQDLAAARALLLKSVPLLKEVIVSHADPDDQNYNECERPDERCAWCEDAQTIIDAALAAAPKKNMP